MLLPIAVQAGLPIIAIQTDDPMNVVKVFKHVTGVSLEPFPKTETPQGSRYKPDAVKQGRAYLMVNPSWDSIRWDRMYAALASKKATLVVVNPPKIRPEFFDGGTLTCPETLVRAFVDKWADAEEGDDEFEALVSALSGLSYQSMINLSLLSSAKGGFTARAVREIRREFFGTVHGLQQESTDSGFYLPSVALTDWMALDGQLLAHGAPKELVPKGLLLDGPAGTGKTEGARFIARELGLPLYRLDVGATMNKYIGESERRLAEALAQADRCAPCVVLMDEAEKLFAQKEDGGTSSRALSALLWWMQERKSRVLVVMTTNDKGKLPPELIRPGRIDHQFYFGPLDHHAGLVFARKLAENYKHLAILDPKDLSDAIQSAYEEGATPAMCSHAHITAVVMGMIKKQYLKTHHPKENNA